MSHTPGALISRRYLNAIRPANGTVGPPVESIEIFSGLVDPVPPQTVMGAALAAQLAFSARCTVDTPETFESFFTLDNLDGVPLSSNGNTFTTNSALSAQVSGSTVSGRFNTTPAGLLYYEIPFSSDFEILLPANTAGIGLYFTDIGDFVIAPVQPAFTITLTDNLAVETTYDLPNSLINGSLLFWGMIDSRGTKTYSKAVISKLDPGGDIIGIDDVRIVLNSQIV